MCGYIYKITNLVNGKLYIGQTKHNVDTRFKEHSKASSIIGRAIRKYGKDNFTIEIIEEVEDYSTIDARETYWINAYDSTNCDCGYNVSTGGQGVHGYNHTDETKKIISNCSAGRVRLHKNGVNKLVKPKDYDLLVSDGWTEGWDIKTPAVWTTQSRDKMSQSQQNRKPFTNGEIEVHLTPDQIPDYISQGYSPGTIRNGVVITPLHITNGKEDKLITSSKWKYYSDRKWVRGTLNDFSESELTNIFNDFESHRRSVIEERKKKFSNARKGHSVSESTKEKLREAAKLQVHTKEQNLKISMALKGRKTGPKSEHQKKLLSTKNKGKIIVNDGINETSIQESELESYLDNGYARGHIKTKQFTSDTVWMNNGVTNRRVRTSMINDFISQGYTKGRVKK